MVCHDETFGHEFSKFACGINSFFLIYLNEMFNSLTLVAGVFAGHKICGLNVVLRWNGDVAGDAISKWNDYEPYCYEALKEVPKVVCMKTSLAIGLLWSVCDMVCNDETSGSLLLNVVFENTIQLILFAHVSVSRTDQMCIARKLKEPMNDLETYQMIVERPVCRDGWCCRLAMLFCQNLEWHWNLLPLQCNEHCLSHVKPFQLRPVSPSMYTAFFDQLSWHVCPDKLCTQNMKPQNSLKRPPRSYLQAQPTNQVLPICP